MPESELEPTPLTTFDTLAANMPLLPSGTPRELGIIAHSNTSEIDDAIHAADQHLVDTRKVASGSMVKKAEDAYETSLNTVGQYSQLGIRDARTRIDEARMEQKIAELGLPHAEKNYELGEKIEKKQTRLALPVIIPTVLACAALGAVTGHAEGTLNDTSNTQSSYTTVETVLNGTALGGMLGAGIGAGLMLAMQGSIARIRARRQLGLPIIPKESKAVEQN